MATNINFNALNPPVNAFGAFQAGMENGRALRNQQVQQNALAAYARNPNDPNAARDIIPINPQLGFSLQDRQRDETYRSALADYVAPGSPPRAPSPASPAGQAPAADYRAAVDRQTEAFARMAQADPIKALAAQKAVYDNAKARIDSVRALYNSAYQELGAVNDDASYQRVLARVRSEFEPYGIDVGALVPPQYPGPDGIRELRYRALEAKDQLVAADRYMRLKWDIADDQIDNEALADYREGQLSNARRGQDIASSDRRRGQDITDARGRRGQDLAGARSRGGRGGKSDGASAGPIAEDGNGNRVRWNGKAWVPLP